jgi:hypothetical protein
MKKREIEDKLDQYLDGLKEEIKKDFDDYINNPDNDKNDYQNDRCDRISEICDQAVPIYYYDIDCLWFFADTDFVESYYNNFGNEIDLKDYNRFKTACIYSYFTDQANEYIQELIENA